MRTRVLVAIDGLGYFPAPNGELASDVCIKGW